MQTTLATIAAFRVQAKVALKILDVKIEKKLEEMQLSYDKIKEYQKSEDPEAKKE